MTLPRNYLYSELTIAYRLKICVYISLYVDTFSCASSK
jgi:hypothetical protein